MLVEAGKPQEAFKQLREVYDEPVSHYDLGFLLNKRGLKPAALQEFTIALRLRPGMTLAQQWVERLSRERDGSGPAAVGMFAPMGQTPPGVAPNPPAFARGGSAAAVRDAATLSESVAAAGHRPVSASAPPPAEMQYPPPGPQNARPQNGGPQYAGSPQFQHWIPASPPAANPPPIVASRDPQAMGVRIGSPPPGNDATLRRLPPVNDPGANSNRDPQGPDIVAPDPPAWRR